MERIKEERTKCEYRSYCSEQRTECEDEDFDYMECCIRNKLKGSESPLVQNLKGHLI